MSIQVALFHRTRYSYDRLVALSPHTIRLRPCVHSRTAIESYALHIEPGNHFINWQQDPFGNFLARVVFPEKTRELCITVDLIANLKVFNPFDFFLEEYAERFPFEYTLEQKQELLPFLTPSDESSLLAAYLEEISREEMPTVPFLSRLVQKLATDIHYLIRMQPGVQSTAETLQNRSGSCRDSTFLLVQILRKLGLAARFTSGYLIQLTPDNRITQADGPDSDFTDLHAWTEVYLPGAGWVGLDATSGLFAGEGHIPLAATPEPGSAAPISGAADAAGVDFHFEMKVERLSEKPRSTKPFAERAWLSLLACGDQVEEHMQKEGLRLTMGGEPTFTAIKGRDRPEWNTEAQGPHKRELAERLIKELKYHFAPQGILQFTQGKWYPGEMLPRFSLNCYAIEDVSFQIPEFAEHPASIKNVQEFAHAFLSELHLPESLLIPAFEDLDYYRWKAAAITHGELSLYDQAEKERARRIISQGQVPVGYVLPLAYNEEIERWQTCHWKFSRGLLYAIGGDSALGYRLPLTAIEDAIDLQRIEHNPLTELPAARAAPRERAGMAESTITFKTAACFELREGQLYVFLPPVGKLEQWVGLVEAAQAAARKCHFPFVLEGYEPPTDYRLSILKVTPDPGVIEVNIPPVSSWKENVANTGALYAAATRCELTAEKFLLDGRIAGTGGGNHITLGATHPSRSPFFQRPALLRGLITYWQHHPALSYLFSGLFIGPTSQAPRIDEARDETLHELEIALKQVDILGTGESAPWKLDRLLRNFLIDLTGNTHRAEICIDKLYSPDSQTGRLGLVELRGFEMPPHYQMSIAQQLLVRSIVLRLWKTPYAWPLEQWNTRLHDQFLLPHFVWQDFLHIIADLNNQGLPLEAEWYLPFYEFRFPEYGRTQVQDIEIELRQALEPWNVLGETVFQSGTSRPVDSALERMQIVLRNHRPGRYDLVCNGYVLPLHKTGKKGEFVTGVRYKAWAPTFTLHPYIPVQAPLTLELYDRQTESYTGGCRYHVAHPGGRNYDVLPVNQNEAEARRISRFESFGHSPRSTSPPVRRNTRGLFTFDLLEATVGR
ncbi:MAG: transglutaminase family protein [Spirochaetales bacterium]|nr:transglutaminase family protein [Spirochaetales bacterium]